MAESAVVDVEKQGQVLVITIRRPEVRNAVDAAVAHGLGRALRVLDEEDSLRVGVLTGAGGVFCAGADLRARAAGERVVDEDGFAGVTRRARDKPLIAAVEGAAVGGGFELVLACDMVVAAEDAIFALPEVSRSVLAAEGGLYRTIQTLGRNVAMQLALTGDPITADRAYALGLVNVLAPRHGALSAALALAERVARNAPEAVRQSRRVIAETAGERDASAWERTQTAYRLVKATDDYREGVRAFLERRAPRWRGMGPGSR